MSDLNLISSLRLFTNRYFPHKPRKWKRMEMLSTREEDTHKQTGTSCIETSPDNIFKKSHLLFIFLIIWGAKNFKMIFSFQTNFGAAIKEKNKCDSGLPSQCRTIM